MPPIIDEPGRRLPRLLAATALVTGAAAWWWYSAQDLVLSHYDTKGHLVVARRVFDNLTPGWQQIGAVWLPLPHLLNMIPVQVDALYRTGLSASVLSIVSVALAVYAAARLVLQVTGSPAGACLAAVLMALNPNLLYLQTTPMTEPLLLGLTFLAAADLHAWIQSGSDGVPRRLGWTLAAAAWTRYEAWPVIGALTALSALAWWRGGTPSAAALRRAARLAVWPAVAVGIFLVNSRITVGSWFISSGFFVPDPAIAGQPWRDLTVVAWGTSQLAGTAVTAVGLVTAAVVIVRAAASRAHAPALVVVAPLAAAVLPALAFFQGHPFRIRYMVPEVAAVALLSGIAAGWSRRLAWGAALAVAAAAFYEAPPLSRTAPMVAEAQWDRPFSVERRTVTACLAPAYRGELVLASMGSLAHYMQELSSEGFDIADFVNEGNGVIWELALTSGPAAVAGWMLVEEQAEGGDVLAQRIRAQPSFAAGMTPVCEGGGVTLYRRNAVPALARAS